MQAVRAAAKALNSTDLSGCTVYASGYPCPMCLTAMYLSGVEKVYYAYSSEDGAPFGTVRILRDMSEAEELVQEVFLYVHNKCASFDPGKSYFRSWLIQIAYSRAFNKRDYLTRRRFYDYCNIDEVLHSVRSHICLENQAELAELREICEQALAELTERQRRTLKMFFFEGLTLREISSQMDESLVQISHHYYRGLDKLRTVLNLNPTSNGNGRANGR